MSDAEREAVSNRMTCEVCNGSGAIRCRTCDEYLDAYRAAVAAVEYERGRRAERERIVQVVEGMKRRPEYTNGVCDVCEQYSSFCHCGTVDSVLAALLDRLREGEA
jgi:hypothetical protein